MLQSMTWFATDNLARSQFQVFSQLGDQMQLSEDDQRRVLLLSKQEWSNWWDFLQDGPLPAQPQLPVMLQRLGSASHRLAVMADRLGIAEQASISRTRPVTKVEADRSLSALHRTGRQPRDQMALRGE
jgi:hypothetical protein